MAGNNGHQETKIYHVHVYPVSGKLELDIGAPNPKIATQAALKFAKNNKAQFQKADCNFIAIIPGVK